MAHLETEKMVRYLAGETDDDETLAVQRHLGECSDCLARLRGVQLLRDDFDGVWERWTAADHAALARELPETKSPSRELELQAASAVAQTNLADPETGGARLLRAWASWTSAWQRIFGSLSPPRLAWAGAAAVVLVGLGYVLLRQPASLQLADAGGTVRVLADGRIRLPGGMALGDAWQDRLAPLLRGEAVGLDAALTARLEALRSQAVRLGSSERLSPRPLSPVGVLVRPGPVTFRWQGVEGATNYTFLVSDGTRALVERATGGNTNLVLAPTEVALAPGSQYEWQVAAVANDELLTCSPVRFAVLEAATARELERVEAIAGRSALVMAGLYLQFGLLDDAAFRLDELRRSNPDSPLVARLDQFLATARGGGP